MASSVDVEEGTGLRTLCRGKNYADSVLSSLADLQEHQSLTDFMLQVGDRTIHVHKCILKISSEYFRALFDSGMTEINTGEVKLDTFDFDAVKTMIDYIYGRQIQVDMDNLIPLLSVVEHFLLEELKERLIKMIVEHLKPDNCIYWLQVADQLNINELKQITKEMVRIEFNEAAFSDDFLDLKAGLVVECIQHDIPLNANTVLKACLNWIMVDADDRKKDFATFAEHTDFSLCSPEYLKYVHDTYQDLGVLGLCEDISSQLSSDMNVEPEDHVPMKESILMCSGHHARSNGPYHGNGFLYEITMCTNNVHQIIELPSQCVTTMPALCSTPQGIFGAGGKPDVNFAPSIGCIGCWLYNKYSHQVEILPSLSVPIYGAGAVFLDNKVYMIGGHPAEHDTVNIFDMVTYEWSSGPKLLHQVHYPKVAAIGYNIFVLHDNDNVTDLIPLQCLDTCTNKWSSKAPLPASMTHTSESSMVAAGDLLYVMADGWYKYNTITDTWFSLSRPVGCYGKLVEDTRPKSVCPVVMGDDIAVCGGWEPQYLPSYNCSQHEWTDRKCPDVMRDLTMSFTMSLCSPIMTRRIQNIIKE